MSVQHRDKLRKSWCLIFFLTLEKSYHAKEASLWFVWTARGCQNVVERFYLCTKGQVEHVMFKLWCKITQRYRAMAPIFITHVYMVGQSNGCNHAYCLVARETMCIRAEYTSAPETSRPMYNKVSRYMFLFLTHCQPISGEYNRLAMNGKVGDVCYVTLLHLEWGKLVWKLPSRRKNPNICLVLRGSLSHNLTNDLAA